MQRSPDHRQPVDGRTLCLGCGYRIARPTKKGGTRTFCWLHGDKLTKHDLACSFWPGAEAPAFDDDEEGAGI